MPASVQRSLNPRIAASTVLKSFTIVSSFGYFSQAPDYQYLVNAAFDDVNRTGRFRVGNPNLGFERAWQFEFNVRMRPTPNLLLKTGVYVRQLYGLVASVPQGFNPDSSIFTNADYGTVRGFEAILERAIVGGWGLRLLYTLQFAEANSSNAFLVRSCLHHRPDDRGHDHPGTDRVPLRLRPAARLHRHPAGCGVAQRRARRCWAASRLRSGRAR